MSRSTVAYAAMREFADGWEKIYPSAVCAGIVGDARHQARGGYHIGRRFQSARNYSCVRPDDRRGPDDGSSAVDMSMSRADMILCADRVAAVYRNTKDPRRKYINAINCWHGKGEPVRYDFYARKTSPATRDHRGHVHAEQRRLYITDKISNEAVLSILRGESVSTWLKRHGVTTTPGPAAGAKPSPRPKTVTAPPYPGRVLQRNDKATKPDAAVRMWQQRMRDRGWTSIGPADGLPGAKFEIVVRKWQTYLKLTPDGKVGPKTWPTPWTRPLGG